MCGICGFAYGDASVIATERRVSAMAETIAHRGPDDAGYFTDGPIGLGHRRLSIVDLATGHQPMANEDETVRIVFNGEIYNHHELRPALESAGHRYRTRSDTETIIHLYEQHGAQAPRYLRGMFAFAIWDSKDGSLFLARDHSGIKPLYYAVTPDDTLVFASEIKALFASGLLTPAINEMAVEEYLTTGHVSGEQTLFTGIKKLAPGSSLRWQQGRLQISSFWNVASPPAELRDGLAATHPEFAADAAPAFWQRFMSAVDSQLMSDVPLGVFLSGGLDSSLIVAAMREAGVPTIRSFSVGYREAEASELPWARLVSDAMQTSHHEVLVDGADFFSELPNLTWHRDLPLTFSASIPLYAVSKLAREHVKVVLTGEGSDELFAGYGRYPRALANLTWARRLDHALPGALRRAVAEAANHGGSGYLGSRIARSFLAKRGTIEASCLEPFAEFTGRSTTTLLKPDVPRGKPFGDLSDLFESTLVSRNPLEALLRYDQRTYMEELLMKQDTMSMAASIESRVPFLDHRLVEWAASLAPEVKLRGRIGKALVRDAAASKLPQQVVHGPKRGFLVPLARWLRDVGRETLERYAPGRNDELLSHSAFRTLIAEHNAGMDHTGRLWRVLALQVWRQDTLPRMEQLSAAQREYRLSTVTA